MDIETITTLVGGLGMWTVGFAWAVWERRRNAELQRERLRDMRAWMNHLAKSEIFPAMPNGDDE